MQNDLIKFLKEHPCYADLGGPRFMEGMRRVRKYMPRSRITDFLFARKRQGRKKLSSDPLYELAKRDEYMRDHMELLPKIRGMVQDKLNLIKRPYGYYSLPKRSKISKFFGLIKKLTYKMEVCYKEVVIERSYPIKMLYQIENKKKINKIEGKDQANYKYDVEHQECKRIRCETQCHIWPGDDEPKELIKRPQEEEANEEDMLQLLFLTIVHMIEKKYRLPIGRIVQLKEYLDVMLIEMLKEVYTMRELCEAGICDDILLLIGGIEPNPGPNCTRCGDHYVNLLTTKLCPRCAPSSYYGNVGLLYEELLKKGLRCTSCFRPLVSAKVDYMVLYYALVDIKCQTCTKYYTTNRIPGQPPSVKAFFDQVKNIPMPTLTLNQLIEGTPQWRQMQREIDEEMLWEMKQFYSYIHPYVTYKMSRGIPFFTSVTYNFCYRGSWCLQTEINGENFEFQLPVADELSYLKILLEDFLMMNELINIIKDAEARK